MTRSILVIAGSLAVTLLAVACAQQDQQARQSKTQEGQQVATQHSSKATIVTPDDQKKGPKKMKVATFGAGCFWCVEAVFQRLEGVSKIEPGYCNGQNPNPTYQEVCSGLSGHAEVCRIEYDPAKVTYAELLEVFWKTHDPTTLNRQGADAGTQYRSAVFYHDDEQKQVAEKYKKRLDESGAFDAPIVTEIEKAETFYVAEDYHKNYFNDNSNTGYCQAVIVPKLKKFKQAFADKLKK